MSGEVLYYGLASLFFLAPRVLYDLHIDEEEPTTFPPSTLVVTNHKRDLDSVIHTATLFWLQRHPRVLLHFAGREDMFYRGFLAGYDVVPRWLRRLLYEIDLTPVMRALRVHPVRRFPERTMEEALREALAVLGDRPVQEVLAPDEADPLIRLGGGVRLSGILAWELRDHWQRPARLRAFHPDVCGRLEARQREVVHSQMRALADVLAGGALYMAPEGVISPDGRLQAFRSGLRQILTLARGVRIRPACIVYDFMRPGPLRVFISVGRLDSAAGDPERIAGLTRRRLAALHTMTASQLCSQAVWEGLLRGQTAIDARGLADAAARLAGIAAGEGLRVDRGFLTSVPQRASEWIRYAQGRGVLTPDGEAWRIDPAVVRNPATHWGNPVRYCANELQSVRAALRGEVEAVASG